MRRLFSVLLLVVAVSCLLAGTALAVVFGTDDRVETGAQPVSGSSSVVTSTPDVLPIAGSTVRLTATVDGSRPVFVGLGNAVDVLSYTERAALTSIDDVSLRLDPDRPLRIATSAVGGVTRLPAAPTDVDWWLASAAGRGQAVLVVELPADPASLVVIALDGAPLDQLVLSATYELPGAFGIGVGLVGLGLGLVLFAWVTRQLGRSPAPPQVPDWEQIPRATAAPGRSERAALLVGLAVAASVTVSGCEWPRPVTGEPSKLAAQESEAVQVVERWAGRRAEALRRLDSRPLRTVEAARTLQIDEGAFDVAERLFDGAAQEVRQDLRLQEIQSPRLGSYPLWFLARVRDGEQDVSKLQVHRRASAAGRWRLVAQADVLAQTELPTLAVDRSGAIEPVAPDDRDGLSASPQDVADDYARLLDDPGSGGDAVVAVDSFVQQMRTIVAELATIDGVELEQSWSAADVRWAVRTNAGGAMVFATLSRTDDYRLPAGGSVDWPAGSEQQALLADSTERSPTLGYVHQVLLVVPPVGTGPASALGQYGGVVRGPTR